jgi:hypothetical protein
MRVNRKSFIITIIVQHPVACKIKITTVTVYASLFMYCLLLKDDSHCDMFRFSYEPSLGNIHVVLTKIIIPTTDPLF